MEIYTLEISKSLSPTFDFGDIGEGSNISEVELAILCGAMMNSVSSFSIDDKGTSLRLEWQQMYPT